ncbi:MAG: 30S ribosomal protein S17 [Candidatus Eisenbacteria bacterium]
MSETRSNRKVREGVVVSNKADRTIVVAESKKVPHPLYKRYVSRTKKFYAHDENNECNIGDTVRIMETRPMSKMKRWRLVSVLVKAR